MLREQVRLQQAEVDTINRQMRNAYDAGFAQGQSAGYQAAMNSMLAGGNRPNPRESRMAEEDEADDLRRALDESRLNPRPSRPTQNPGAGPSRSSERPAQNRNEGARTRGPNPNMPIVTTSGDYREYEFTSVRRGGVEYPHERYPGLTSLPFPVAETTFPRRGIAVVRVPRTIPSVEESTTYSDLWANFADGRTVPDPIRRLSRALGASFSEFEARDAVLGYGLVRRINAALHGVLDRDAVHAFLVTLAAFDRTLRLTEGSDSLWSSSSSVTATSLLVSGLRSAPTNTPKSTLATISGSRSPRLQTPTTLGESQPCGNGMNLCKFSLPSAPLSSTYVDF